MTEIATFGAGCFWGAEAAFRHVAGVLATTVGFMGGHVDHPTYEQVCTHTTGHTEVVQVEYDPEKVSYRELLNVFWECHDPTQVNRQGPDVGVQYRSVIFFHTPKQLKLAKKSKEELDASGRYKKPIATAIEPAQTFWKAEEYHQHYYEKLGIAPACNVRSH
jgi:peptide-methionine (S)-S-oxide reductase